MAQTTETFIREILTEDYNLKGIKRLAKWVGDDRKRLKQLMDVVVGKEELLAQRAAWALGHCEVLNNRLLDRELPRLIKTLQQVNKHPAIPRNILRVLQDYPVPEKYSSVLLDVCFRFVSGAVYPPAIRAFAMTTAAGICKGYPELKGELEMIVRELLLYPQPPAILSRSKKVLKQLRA